MPHYMMHQAHSTRMSVHSPACGAVQANPLYATLCDVRGTWYYVCQCTLRFVVHSKPALPCHIRHVVEPNPPFTGAVLCCAVLGWAGLGWGWGSLQCHEAMSDSTQSAQPSCD